MFIYKLYSGSRSCWKPSPGSRNDHSHGNDHCSGGETSTTFHGFTLSFVLMCRLWSDVSEVNLIMSTGKSWLWEIWSARMWKNLYAGLRNWRPDILEWMCSVWCHQVGWALSFVTGVFVRPPWEFGVCLANLCSFYSHRRGKNSTLIKSKGKCPTPTSEW